MKKTFFALAFSSLLIACKKENSNPNSPVTKTPTTVEDTTKKTVDSVSCVDNPKINFSCVGTPVGKFSNCIKDIDGNVYKTVIIGKQQWMAENLKVSRYNDGTVIPNVKDGVEWFKTSSSAWCYLNNDSLNDTKFGKLYNSYAVNYLNNGNKNICPVGWHIPTDNDWFDLINYLGDSLVVGSKMKEIGLKSWLETDSSVVNTSLFTALPSGYRYCENGDSFFILGRGTRSVFWISKNNSNLTSKFYKITSASGYIQKEEMENNFGASIRCIKD
jgi:uncharacterized protein (TIGR02145 family)